LGQGGWAREYLKRKAVRKSRPATISPERKRFALPKGRIRALTGLKSKLQRMGLVIKIEKDKGVAGKGGRNSLGYAAPAKPPPPLFQYLLKPGLDN
jgi:hypothetical protein